MRELAVKTIAETLDHVLNHRSSVARFGEGEMDIIAGHSIPFQDYDGHLAEGLRQVLAHQSDDTLLVCLPEVFSGLEAYTEGARSFWQGHLDRYQDFYSNQEFGSWYGSSFISRPYIDLADKSQSASYFEQLKAIWQDQDVLIVEGETTRSGMGNDLFAGAKSVSRIVCPSKNAYAYYDDIAQAIRQHGQDKLVLLMLGPTAKVLSYNLSREGFWTIDIGHIDSEYEWFLMGAEHKVKLAHKHTAEHNHDGDITFTDLADYDRQVVAFIRRPLVSVVVPIYNVEEYLEQCVRSLINQTYTNLELILVNDGSTDGSAAICERLAQEDSRIKVITKENGGVSDSRNQGIDAAQGEFITFVDSDDFVSENYVERLCQTAVVHGAKIAVGEYYRLADGLFSFHATESTMETLTPTQYLDKLFIGETMVFATPWGKLFAKELFDGEFPIRFPVGYVVGEDKVVSYLLAWKTDCIIYLRESLYCYRHREGSATTVGTSLKRASDDLAGTESQITDLVLMGYDIKHAVAWYQYILLVHEQYLSYAGLTDNDLYRKIKKKIALFKNEYR